MNEQIRELVMESVNFRLDPDSNHYEAQVSPEDLEYLAELIVKECARAIINDGRLNDVRSAANGCVRTIKEHFGVEE